MYDTVYAGRPSGSNTFKSTEKAIERRILMLVLSVSSSFYKAFQICGPNVTVELLIL